MQDGLLMEANGITKRFEGLTAVNSVTFNIKRGVIKALIGPNGAGKSTMINMLSGIFPPTTGEVYVKKKLMNGRRSDEFARLGVGRTFQTVQLFGNMTVLENVMVGLHTKSSSGMVASALNLPWVIREEKAVFNRAIELLSDVGLESRAFEVATNLPYGQQRLLEVARAMASEPEVLLLDEPAAGLSMRETQELAALVQKIRDSGLGILVVDHDMQLIMEISDEVVVLDHGSKIAEGTPDEIQSNPAVVSAYLGEEL